MALKIPTLQLAGLLGVTAVMVLFMLSSGGAPAQRVTTINGTSPGVLVAGGSGYLGQFVAKGLLRDGWKVTLLYHSADPSALRKAFPEPALSLCRADLRSERDLRKCLQLTPLPRAVVNCAAVAEPLTCKKNPDYCVGVNVPEALLEAMRDSAPGSPLVHISTDQVYSGMESYATEETSPGPVNDYGRTKLQGERLVYRTWPGAWVLRPSIIYGPPPPAGVSRGLFLQWLNRALQEGEISLAEDQWRSPVWVYDVVEAVRQALLISVGEQKDGGEKWPERRVVNTGGPDRLSRADMGLALCATRGYPSSRVLPVPASSLRRGVTSPADISMNSTRLAALLGRPPRRFRDAAPAALG
eukprot:TRINITY_DN6333_c0_g1_i3.p1 TRINITY_DN6333_c0_g1~~TRINITY_DN6333_c0_g1_i3.p1  ORF type:complete len:356 (+),score=23.08 TRINITY_DN6333_c0_g1_i3:133-1200(+)